MGAHRATVMWIDGMSLSYKGETEAQKLLGLWFCKALQYMLQMWNGLPDAKHHFPELHSCWPEMSPL